MREDYSGGKKVKRLRALNCGGQKMDAQMKGWMWRDSGSGRPMGRGVKRGAQKISKDFERVVDKLIEQSNRRISNGQSKDNQRTR